MMGLMFLVRERVGVVMDVRLVQMLPVRILMRGMVMVYGGMVVLVVVGGRHVLPVRPVPLAVDDASVYVPMHDGVVMV